MYKGTFKSTKFVFYVHQGCIYVVKNTVKTVICDPGPQNQS